MPCALEEYAKFDVVAAGERHVIRFHFVQEIVACDFVFVGLAYVLASKIDGCVSRSLSSLAASATDKFVLI